MGYSALYPTLGSLEAFKFNLKFPAARADSESQAGIPAHGAAVAGAPALYKLPTYSSRTMGFRTMGVECGVHIPYNTIRVLRP